MRFFELLFTISLFLKIAMLLRKEAAGSRGIAGTQCRNGLSICCAAAALSSIVLEGFRFVMFPQYLLGFLFCISEVLCFLRHHGESGAQKIRPAAGKNTRNLIAAVFAGIFMTASVIAEWYFPVTQLPKPSGSLKTGTVIMDFENQARTNILTGKKERQKMAVQIWYPAEKIQKEKCAVWMNRKTASLFAKYEGLPDIFGQFAMVPTNSYLAAPVSTAFKSYPVIFFSGGGGMFNGQNTVQMEELASNGYIVMAVSHPKDDFATIHADGTVTDYDEKITEAVNADMTAAIKYMKQKYRTDKVTPEMQRATIRAARLSDEEARVWAEDICFAADQAEKMNEGVTKSLFQGRLDIKHMGVFGHSLGGAAAGEACLTDSRFKAFINMDGTPFGDTVNQVIRQPFMVLGTGVDSHMKFRACDGYSPNQKNFLIVSIDGTEHMNFTDFNTVLARSGGKLGILGRIDHVKQTKITNAYVLAFFNHELRGEKETLLKSGESSYAGVKVEQRIIAGK